MSYGTGISDITGQPAGGTTPGGSVTPPVASALANAPAPAATYGGTGQRTAPTPAPTTPTPTAPADGVRTGPSYATAPGYGQRSDGGGDGAGTGVAGGGDGTTPPTTPNDLLIINGRPQVPDGTAPPDGTTPSDSAPGGPPGLPDVNIPLPLNPQGGGGLFGGQEQGMWVPNLLALGGTPADTSPVAAPAASAPADGTTPAAADGGTVADGTTPATDGTLADGTINNAGLAGTLNNAVDTGPP